MESEPTNSNQNMEKKSNSGEKHFQKNTNPNNPNRFYHLNYYRLNNYPHKYQFYPKYTQGFQYPHPYYNEYELQKQLLYRAEKYIIWKYPELLKINQMNEKISETINENCRFLEIKALTEEDIHKSIKYCVWSCYKDANIKLNEIYNKAKENNGDTYEICEQ